MGKDDYKTIGGALKIKGAKPTGVDKHKKKKKRPPTEDANESSSKAAGGIAERADAETSELARSNKESNAERELLEVGKTEAERRHEEMRRRRLSDRLAREGTKTHKERVEELNRYLSTLSEHHDMPRIGPG